MTLKTIMNSAAFVLLATAGIAQAATTTCSLTNSTVTAKSTTTSCDITLTTQQGTTSSQLSGECELLCGNDSALIVQAGTSEVKVRVVTSSIGAAVTITGEHQFAAPTADDLTYSGTETHWVPLDSSSFTYSGTETHWVVPPGSDSESRWLVFTSTYVASVWTSGLDIEAKLATSVSSIDWSRMVWARLDFDESELELSCTSDCTP